MPKNQFQTNLFFAQQKQLKCTFAIAKNLKIQTPPSFQKVKIFNFRTLDFWH